MSVPNKPPDQRVASPVREYLWVLAVMVFLTVAAWFTPLTHHALGQVYLLAVILLCLWVGRGPMILAAISSALAWNFFFIPPQFSFGQIGYDDAIQLGIYFAVAITAGQLIARIRTQEYYERRQQQKATTLYRLSRALEEGIDVALQLTAESFGARVALLLVQEDRTLAAHPAGSLVVDAAGIAVAGGVTTGTGAADPATGPTASSLRRYIPVSRAGTTLGVLVIEWPGEPPPAIREQAEVLGTFAPQIALYVEREQLRAAAEREKLLAESDRLHRTLFDSVSHELKTPLSVLRSAGEQLDAANEDKRSRLAAEVRTATQRLDRLVANLLDQTRLESGRLRPQLDWCDARDLVNAARRAVGDALAGRVCQLEIPEDMPLFRADAPLMEHVLENLLLNAARYTPAGTPLEVQAGWEAVTDRVFIRITDHGPGIPADLRANLFQKFSRGTAARAGGLGLGLSIVRGFMQAQGGEVTVGDNPAGGATFTVWLPHHPHSEVPNDER